MFQVNGDDYPRLMYIESRLPPLHHRFHSRSKHSTTPKCCSLSVTEPKPISGSGLKQTRCICLYMSYCIFFIAIFLLLHLWLKTILFCCLNDILCNQLPFKIPKCIPCWLNWMTNSWLHGNSTTSTTTYNGILLHLLHEDTAYH